MSAHLSLCIIQGRYIHCRYRSAQAQESLSSQIQLSPKSDDVVPILSVSEAR